MESPYCSCKLTRSGPAEWVHRDGRVRLEFLPGLQRLGRLEAPESLRAVRRGRQRVPRAGRASAAQNAHLFSSLPFSSLLHYCPRVI